MKASKPRSAKKCRADQCEWYRSKRKFSFQQDLQQETCSSPTRWSAFGLTRLYGPDGAVPTPSLPLDVNLLGEELSVFYCEEAIAFLRDCGMDDEGYYSALVLMFQQALEWVTTLTENQQKPLLERLGRIRTAGWQIGWGVGDEMADLWSRFT